MQRGKAKRPIIAWSNYIRVLPIGRTSEVSELAESPSTPTPPPTPATCRSKSAT